MVATAPCLIIARVRDKCRTQRAALKNIAYLHAQLENVMYVGVPWIVYDAVQQCQRAAAD